MAVPAGVNAADTVFMFVSMILVQFMTPGLAFFYGGLVRSTNILTIMIQSFLAMGVVFVIWYLLAFSLAFGESIWGVIGNPMTYGLFENVEMDSALPNAPNIPGALFASYQGMFAVITPALMTGAFADRLLIGPYVALIVIWTLLVYAPACHWIWGGGFMQQWGCWDFAGGIVVHTTSGFSAIATLMILGPRNIEDPDHKQPHNIPFVALGTAMLWFGWFGFNGGSALGLSPAAMSAAINSQLSACVALVVWLTLDLVKGKKPSLVGSCVGAVAGLATITPCAGYVPLWSAFLVGVAASLVCYHCVLFLEKLHLDDALDVWGVHGMGGVTGSILAGVFADDAVNPGAANHSVRLVFIQTACAVLVAVYSFGVTFVTLRVMDKLIRIRPPKMIEGDLDKALHGEVAYVTHTSNPNLLEDGHSSMSEDGYSSG